MIRLLFHRSIQKELDEKAIFGDKTLVNYLSDRLKYSVEATKAIIQKHPGVNKVQGTRVCVVNHSTV